MQVRKAFIFLALVLILPVQNVAIFQGHYFQEFVFPDDFLLTYHAVPSYWIEVLAQGKDIAWIPVQAMGYPLYMALQSGYGYLPLRAFAWLGMPYTIHAAVVLQGLHVLLGAVGATVCARLLGVRWRHALMAGVLYQCFGGFYSNAQHPDIVRSFAFLPWLAGPVLADWRPRRLLAICIALLPVWGYAQFTGGYPGVAIASTLLLGALAVARICVQKDLRRTGWLVLAAQAAGPLLAGWVIVPPTLDAGMIDRSAQVGQLQYDYLQLRDLLALSFPVNRDFFGHDVSMRSLFLALPGYFLLAATFRRIREVSPWPLWCAVLALLIAMGPLHRLLVAVFPPAGLSRFVMADYRGFIVLGMILTAVQGLALAGKDEGRWRLWPLVATGLLLAGGQLLGLPRAHVREDQVAQLLLLGVAIACCLPVPVEGRTFALPAPSASSGPVALALTWLHRGTRGVLWVDALVAGLLVLLLIAYLQVAAAPHLQVITLCVLAAATLLLVRQGSTRFAVTTLMLLAVITVADWKRVTWGQRYFAPPVQDGVPWLEASIGPFSDARKTLHARLQAQACRAGRVDPPDNAGPAVWAGYYTGEPHLRDHGSKLLPQQTIWADPGSRAFAMRPWTMVAMPLAAKAPPSETLADTAPAVGVACLRAGTTAARYRVDAAATQKLVENELFWPGWTATLTCLQRCASRGPVTLQPTSTHGFRTWTVPAGVWQMDLRFSTPHQLPAWLATGAGLLVWLFVCLLLGRPAWLSAADGRPGGSAGSSPAA